MGHDKFGKNPKETFHPGTQKVGGELFWGFFFCLFVLFLFGFFFLVGRLWLFILLWKNKSLRRNASGLFLSVAG